MELCHCEVEFAKANLRHNVRAVWHESEKFFIFGNSFFLLVRTTVTLCTKFTDSGDDTLTGNVYVLCEQCCDQIFQRETVQRETVSTFAEDSCFIEDDIVGPTDHTKLIRHLLRFEEQVEARYCVCLNKLLQFGFTALRTDGDEDEIGIFTVCFV